MQTIEIVSKILDLLKSIEAESSQKVTALEVAKLIVADEVEQA